MEYYTYTIYYFLIIHYDKYALYTFKGLFRDVITIIQVINTI